MERWRQPLRAQGWRMAGLGAGIYIPRAPPWFPHRSANHPITKYKQRQLIENSCPRGECWICHRGLLRVFLSVQESDTGLPIPSSSPVTLTPSSGGTLQKSSSEGTSVASHPHGPCTCMHPPFACVTKCAVKSYFAQTCVARNVLSSVL